MKYSAFNILIVILLFSFKTLSSCGQISTVNGKTIPVEVMDNFLKQKMDSLHMPGLSIAFIDKGNIVYHREMGYANLEKQIRVDENTLFEACSMSKTVFAYFVLKMVDKGLLTLDKPLYLYYPYNDVAYDERHKLITARMVLDHTTGLPNWHEYQPPDSSLHVPKGAQYFMFTPGTKFSYSGEAYQYLVDVIAHLLHTNLIALGDTVYKEVCVPLGMNHSWFGLNEFVQEHKAIGYRQNDSTGVNSPGVLKKFEEFSAAGGLHTNATDFARFLIGLMNEKGLKKATFQEMFKPQSHLADSSWIEENGEAWGLGLAINQTPYGTRYMHSGNNGDFTCYYIMYKEQKKGYVFLTNYNGAWDLFDKLEPLFTEGM